MKQMSAVLARLARSAPAPAVRLQGSGKSRRPCFFATLIAEFFGRKPKLKSIAFVSSAAKEGSTHCVRLFCEDMTAITNYRTAVVRPGDQAIHGTDLVPIGAISNSEPSRDFRPLDIGAHLRRRGIVADVVVLDGGALEDSNFDLLPLLAAVDGVVLVVEAGRTTHSQIMRSAAIVTNCGGRLLGMICNKRIYPIPGWLYRLRP